MLVAGGIVIPDERHLADGDGEQVEPARLGRPSQAGIDRGRVAGLQARAALGAGGAADLELSLAAVAAGDDAVFNGNAVCLPALLCACDPSRPGAAARLAPQRSEDERRSAVSEPPGEGHHSHGMWLSAEQRPSLIRYERGRG